MKPLVKNPDSIKLGIIGLTEGNYHPYSWSAIINGYDKEAMTSGCPVKAIPEYLNREPTSSFDIKNANVTHIFCDDVNEAENAAKCSLIPNVVNRPEDMIGLVDAVIIATDIGSEHVRRATPFIEAGLPLFIDKPLCDNLEDLKIFKKWHEEGKAFISSSCRKYAKEYVPYQISTAELGKIESVSITMCKYWETYGIHALESFYSILGSGFVSVQNLGDREKNHVVINHKNGAFVSVLCGKNLKAGALILNGREKELAILANDTFYSFKKQLESFIEYLRTGKEPHPFTETIELMKIIIAGIMSREENGRKIYLKELEL